MRPIIHVSAVRGSPDMVLESSPRPGTAFELEPLQVDAGIIRAKFMQGGLNMIRVVSRLGAAISPHKGSSCRLCGRLLRY
jgi:hypothetical protein